MEQLVWTHKTQLLQGSDAAESEDIQQVNYHLDKIKSSFVGLVEKGIDLKAKFTEAIDQESSLHKSIVDQQQVQIKLAQEDKDRAIIEKSDLEKTMANISARNEELESNNKTHSITIQIQQEKLEQLESRIESVQALEQEVSRLHQESQMQTKQLQDVGAGIFRLKRQLEQAQASKEAQEKDASKATEQMKQFHTMELEKAVLETEKRIRMPMFPRLKLSQTRTKS